MSVVKWIIGPPNYTKKCVCTCWNQAEIAALEDGCFLSTRIDIIGVTSAWPGRGLRSIMAWCIGETT